MSDRRNPSPAELGAHQKSMAGRAYSKLRGVDPRVRAGSPQAQVHASLAAPALAEAVALQQATKHQEALSALTRAIVIDPVNADARLLACRSLALGRIGRPVCDFYVLRREVDVKYGARGAGPA